MKKSKFVCATLSTDILYNHIFLKLPVKSILRFMSVCKEWNYLLSDQHFVKMHLLQETDDQQKLLLHSLKLKAYYSIDHQIIGASINGGDGVCAVKLHFPLQDSPLTTIIFGSVNGLVCASLVMNQKLAVIIIWNPSTSEYKMLPPNPHVPVKHNHRIGFGYDPIADDYKVMRIVQKKRPRLDVYSLKNSSWKSTLQGGDVPTPSPINITQIRACSVDGSMYWLACHMNRDKLKDQFIACFDLKDTDDDGVDVNQKKLIRKLPMPNDFDTVPGITDMKLLGGCLAVSKMSRCSKTVVVWTMMKIKEKDDVDVGAQYCWSKKLVITVYATSLSCGISNGVRLLPVCISKDGKILLCISDFAFTELVLYDPKTKSIKEINPIHWITEKEMYLEDIKYIAKPRISQNDIFLYRETLVSPNLSR